MVNKADAARLFPDGSDEQKRTKDILKLLSGLMYGIDESKERRKGGSGADRVLECEKRIAGCKSMFENPADKAMLLGMAKNFLQIMLEAYPDDKSGWHAPEFRGKIVPEIEKLKADIAKLSAKPRDFAKGVPALKAKGEKPLMKPGMHLGGERD
ncbi:MAG: hypothetical protein LBG89_03260 [Rickettsiales bacterium]|jgi:hypothetical protein|nr:hypothetical protein [Rickettsiales bacterium]